MKPKTITAIIVSMLLFLASVFVIAQDQKTSIAAGQTETKISEARKNGRYTRTTEVFKDKILISRKAELSLHDDGQIDFISSKLFRDGEMTFASSSYPVEKRAMRIYYHHGKIVAEEGDEDGDGFFETLLVFDGNEQPVQGFTKNKDGSVTHLDAEKFSRIQETFALIEGKEKPQK